ncbi:MAG: Nickel import ATP-binding protein NikO [Rhodocyclaceae bacterium]|nr:MAG: energy-coupling factor ABC transporter ATP-binding protein [Rhodocyclaceae bacterium]MBE7421542.1 energy-coupling factor ABC transporter ATP-binding protein [Zoogloeaceae bacterium]MBV6408788.1 Nickel import ATP-binding protein NikO [Rhodocyclaceae bacterium]CAG0932644.1 Glutamine transport ATP-binding protein GlnQ [Rhodocyclaceae bacterium]
MSPLLVVEGVRKSFGARRLLDIAEIELAAGESYVLTGENGSGKSTFLRVLAGLERAEVNACRFDGRPVELHNYPVWLRREVVYVHQHPYLFRGSIADNIAFGLRARGMGRAERRKLVREAIAWAGMGDLLDVPAHRLSGGEKQLVALARARVLHPRLFLLDEPTANLDAEARLQVIALIRNLCDANSTVLLACHDREIIELPHMHRLHVENGAIAARAVLPAFR